MTPEIPGRPPPAAGQLRNLLQMLMPQLLDDELEPLYFGLLPIDQLLEVFLLPLEPIQISEQIPILEPQLLDPAFEIAALLLPVSLLFLPLLRESLLLIPLFRLKLR